MTYAEIAISVLGALMIVSGGRKLAQREAFEAALRRYQPVASPRLLARGWALVETTAGVACLVPHPARSLGLTWVIAAATGAVARRLVQGETHDCGCHTRPRPISSRALVGNTLGLAALCALSFVFAGDRGLVIALAGIPVAAGGSFFLVGSGSSNSDAETVPKEAPAHA